MLNGIHSKHSIHTIILQQYLSLNNHEIKMIDRVNFSMTIMNDIWKTHLLHFKRHSNLLNICIKFILFLTLCYNDHFMHLSQICMLKDIHVNWSYLFPLNNSQVKNLKNTFYFWEKNLGFKFEMNHLQLYYDLQKTVWMFSGLISIFIINRWQKDK